MHQKDLTKLSAVCHESPVKLGLVSVIGKVCRHSNIRRSRLIGNKSSEKNKTISAVFDETIM